MYICAREIEFACTKKTELSVMYICAREIGFACFSMIFPLDFGTVLVVWYFLLNYYFIIS
jgi:hypothetical protein